MRVAACGLGTAALLALAGCVTGAPPDGPGAVATSPRTGTSTAAPSSAQPSTHTARPRSARPRVAVSFYRAADGTLVTLARFTGPVRYRLHCGSVDPGRAALPVVHAGPSIGHAEYRHLVAAFNGGFLLSAGAGGYEQEGHVISRLRPGLATLVIDRSGQPGSGSGARACRSRMRRCTASGRTCRHWSARASPARPPETGASGALRWAVASTSRAAHWARTRPASSSSPAACPPPRPTWPPPWCTRARVPPWNSTSTRNGCSWTSPAGGTGSCERPSPARSAPRTSTWPAGPATSSPCWPARDSVGTEWPPRPGG